MIADGSRQFPHRLTATLEPCASWALPRKGFPADSSCFRHVRLVAANGGSRGPALVVLVPSAHGPMPGEEVRIEVRRWESSSDLVARGSVGLKASGPVASLASQHEMRRRPDFEVLALALVLKPRIVKKLDQKSHVGALAKEEPVQLVVAVDGVLVDS